MYTIYMLSLHIFKYTHTHVYIYIYIYIYIYTVKPLYKNICVVPEMCSCNRVSTIL